MSIPRFYGLSPSHAAPCLHVFADASIEAHAAVVYFRWEEGEESEVSFVAGKARFAPLKPMTIPRLELTAGMIAFRLADTILKEHEQLKIQYFGVILGSHYPGFDLMPLHLSSLLLPE